MRFMKHINKKIERPPYEYSPTDSISHVILNAEYSQLEQLVIAHFDEILDNSTSNEYEYFTRYPSWAKLFMRNYRHILAISIDAKNYEIISELFPELANEVYDYLFRECIIKRCARLCRNIDIAKDILEPMAYLEKYSNCSFPEVRHYVKEILEATQYYTEFYEAIGILEHEFDISMDTMKPIIETIIHAEINAWISKDERDSEDCIDILKEFFFFDYAYDYFMVNLSEILQIHGIELYAKLIKLLGPVPELIDKQFDCFEFNNI